MKFSERMAAVEAVLFACGEPIELEKLAAAAEIEKEAAERMVERLNERYAEQGSAVVIGKLGDSYQMMTRPEYARYIKTALETRRQAPLSPAALEVLMRSLVERDLLEEHGRLNDVPGHPIAYKTTDNFLRCFKLNSLDDLPPIPGSSDQITLEEYDDADYYDPEQSSGEHKQTESENVPE